MTMTNNEYLTSILEQQTLKEGSQELENLRAKREEVEALIRSEFSSCDISIRYGGSKAKGTMIRDSYDLDIVCYFACDETRGGDSLEDIYNNMSTALSKAFVISPKTSAIRLMGLGNMDFHVDVVPGRFTDEKKADAFIFKKQAEKCRLKTNLDMHVSHIRDSGLTQTIRLAKIWALRNGIRVKTFVLELAVIELLKGYKNKTLEEQFTALMRAFHDEISDLKVFDPANPTGNDLSAALDSARFALEAVAGQTVSQIEADNWGAIFGTAKSLSGASRVAAATVAASASPAIAKPWANEV